MLTGLLGCLWSLTFSVWWQLSRLLSAEDGACRRPYTNVEGLGGWDSSLGRHAHGDLRSPEWPRSAGLPCERRGAAGRSREPEEAPAFWFGMWGEAAAAAPT